MYYPCSENKGADQLHGYREADLLTAKLICTFVFAYANCLFSHEEARIKLTISGTTFIILMAFNAEGLYPGLSSCIIYNIFKTITLNAILITYIHIQIYEPHHVKTNNVVSDHVQHRTGCTSTEDGLRLEMFGFRK